MKQPGEWGIASYIDELAKELAVLGDEDLREELDEVRSHLRDAAAESHEALQEAIEQFGSPCELAAEILEERGFGPSGPELPDAPLWRRALALVADVMVAGVLLVPTLAALGSALYSRIGGSLLFGLTEIAIILALNAAALVWALSYWRRRGADSARTPSFGLALVGVAQVRVGGVVRAVPAARVPHRPGWLARTRALLACAVAALLMWGWVVSMVSSQSLMSTQNVREQFVNARASGVGDASNVVNTATTLYNTVIEQAAADDAPSPPQNVDPTVFETLVARVRNEKIESVDVGSVMEVSEVELTWTEWGFREMSATFTCDVIEHLPGNGRQAVQLTIEKNVIQQDEISHYVTYTVTDAQVSSEAWDDYTPSLIDDNGDTPSAVMSRYLAAKKAGDLRAQYRLLDPRERPEFAVWEKEFNDPAETLGSFDVGDAVSLSDVDAVVEVSFVTKIGGRSVIGEKEGWSVVRTDGVWYVPLMPRQ